MELEHAAQVEVDGRVDACSRAGGVHVAQQQQSAFEEDLPATHLAIM